MYTVRNLFFSEKNEQGSVYKSFIYQIFCLNDIKKYRNNLKKENHKASHICYAYRYLKHQDLQEYYSDSGEPPGSAGLPILNALKKNNMINIVVFVIRYFGGKKIGIPGLIKVYSKCCHSLLTKDTLVKWYQKKNITLYFDFMNENLIYNIISDYNIKVLNKEYNEKAEFFLEINKNDYDDFIDKIKRINNLKIIDS